MYICDQDKNTITGPPRHDSAVANGVIIQFETNYNYHSSIDEDTVYISQKKAKGWRCFI